MRINTKTTIRLDDKRVRRKLGEANAKALKIVGMRVQEKAQRAMSNRSPLQQPKLVKIGTAQGSGDSGGKRRDSRGRFLRDTGGPRDLVAMVTRVPKPDRVTSWKTGRNGKGFLRADIRYAYDPFRGSVVIGPATIPKLNALHEFGGSETIHFYAAGGGPKRSRKFRNPIYGRLTSRRKSKPPIYTFTKSYKPRRYMERGLKATASQIPTAFRDTFKGP